MTVPARRLTHGELISAGSALLLTVVMFALAWYGVDGIPGRQRHGAAVVATITGWQGLTALRWLILLTVIVALGTLAAPAARLGRLAVAGIRLATLVLGCATAVALVIRVLIELPAPDRVVDQKLGALLGLLASFGIAYGAVEAVREQRARLAGPR